jgi:transformation/transcription domain-associated protein
MFHLPAAVSCSPNVRLYQMDSSYVTFGDVYDLHCEHRGFTREEPIIFVAEKIQNILRDYRQQFSKKQVGDVNPSTHLHAQFFSAEQS